MTTQVDEFDTNGPYGIGVVVSTLQDEFPQMEVTVSKVRFLESSGIVKPARTPSGYRKFYAGDVERIRYTLRMQRDHFLPLKVIREHLDKIDHGFEPPSADEPSPQIPSAAPSSDVVAAPRLTGFADGATLTEQDLADQSGLSLRQVAELRKQKVIELDPGSERYTLASLEVVRAVAALQEQGVEARHLRLPVFNAADRQADLIETVVAPSRGSGSDEKAREELQDRVQDLATLMLALQSATLQARLAREYGDAGANQA